MNKERVIVKHYGQLSEPATVNNYLSTCEHCITVVMKQVFNKTIEEIWLHEFISNKETKDCFSKAIEYLESGKRFKALVEIRKALFIEIESEYSVFDWKDTTQGEKNKMGFLEMAFRGGRKAPYYTKNKEWVDANGREPFDYIQLDHQEMRNDLLEWGVNTQDFWNLWRLTPSVFRERKDNDWTVKKETKFCLEGSSEENMRYCLDKAIGLIVKKRSHFDLIKSLHGTPNDDLEVTTTAQPTIVYEKATINSLVKNELATGTKLRVSSVVRGLDGDESFINVIQGFEKEELFVSGYIRVDDCDIVNNEAP